ncbi:exo-poly-alpha-D-galacturonosidase [Actinomycetospora sp. NBRC 106375]|uniref:glycoside hydrolase family 28 protein n=1 Tax=Actinomycetospora sp. NBRC 106375 TaxID=3032207 RepID=UPI0024A4D46E|nr:glycosyl hydrolase family 28-related protein [Actinomycetospora sp. NBRC 106375]GLZ48985.1 exo-poly-alpha-D-galacturonosidase [Actinomycetospora sp. NBRC 106375]
MDATPRRRRWFLGAAATGLGLAGLSGSGVGHRGIASPPGVFAVHEFGARGDGTTRDTAAIQAAIDAAAASGGGIVVFPGGTFLSGTIFLKSRVTLHLGPGAVLLGSPDVADYPARPFPARDLDVGGYEVWALVHAEDAEQITIEGDGVIDGNGAHFPRMEVLDPDVVTRARPRLIFFKSCRSVRLREVTLREAGLWTVHLAMCDTVRISGLSVTSTRHLNQDGIVLDSCTDATVSDCSVDTEDDAVVLKSSFPRACSNVTISNCVLRSRCAGVKLGTQSLGGFRAVAISNLVLHDCRLGGLKFQTVDGGDLEDVTVRDIVMHDVAAPLSFRRGARGVDFGFPDVQRPRPVGALRHVLISQVRATLSAGVPRDGATMSIAGVPGHPVEDVTLENIDITVPGGGTLSEARRGEVPERESAYPEHTMFGVLPAHGLWVRHAARLALRDVRVGIVAPDARAALVCDDVDDLDVVRLRAATSGPEPLVRLRGTRGAAVRGCRPGAGETFVRVEGQGSGDIALVGNDLRAVRVPVATSDGFAGRVSRTDDLVPPSTSGPDT